MNRFLVLLSFLFSSFCFGQKTIIGKVTDPGGDEILGAMVSIKGTDIFTSTDFDGNYSIEAASEDVLVFEFTGYDSKEIIVGNQSVINIDLQYPLELIVFTHNCFPYSESVYITQGFNYGTYGVKFENDYGLLPYGSNFDISYASDFDKNSNYHFALEKGISFSLHTYINFRAEIESANFNENQYHSYKLSGEKSFKLFTDRYFGQFQFITGYIDYDGITDQNNFGYGAGVKKLLKGFAINTIFIHWQEFNEFNANVAYIWRRWSISGNYKHLADYEEFQIGLGYNFYF